MQRSAVQIKLPLALLARSFVHGPNLPFASVGLGRGAEAEPARNSAANTIPHRSSARRQTTRGRERDCHSTFSAAHFCHRLMAGSVHMKLRQTVRSCRRSGRPVRALPSCRCAETSRSWKGRKRPCPALEANARNADTEASEGVIHPAHRPGAEALDVRMDRGR